MHLKRFLMMLALAAAVAPFRSPGAEKAPVGPSIPWRLPSYTLVARDMDLRTALNTFAVAQGLSIVMSSEVTGVFSGDFKNVPATEFLDKVATIHNLVWYYDGAALYLYGAGEISTFLIDLQYMKAEEVREMMAGLGVEDRRFPLRTASNDQLVMVSGPPRYVALVSEIIEKADKLRERRTFKEVETRMFPLTYTWADDVSFRVTSPETSLTIAGVAHLLEQMMNGSNEFKTRDVSVTNDAAAAEMAARDNFRPTIRAENRLNCVIVRDVASQMPVYEKLIKQLDVPQKLVEIDVTVVELSKQDALDWQLSLAYGTRHGHSDIGAGQNAENIFSPYSIGGKGLAGALTHVHAAYTIASSISALKQKGKARSISRTSLLTANNLAAEISDSQSYHAKVVGTEVATLQEVSAGTRLNVKPRILPSISTNVPSQVWLSLELQDGGFEAISVESMPMTRSSTLQTQTAIFENESIMLAGYLRDIEEDAGWGIPYLRDIPWIGWLFGGKSTRKETVQRMFVLTPHIVDLDEAMLARLQASRLRDISEAEELQENAAEEDDEREKREIERNALRQRRREKTEDELERRKAELGHDKKMRQFDRRREKDKLTEDKANWKRTEKAEEEKLKAEEKAKNKDLEWLWL